VTHRASILDLAKLKALGRRFAMVTAYDYASATLAVRAGVDVLLVGDSLGMVVLGHPTTLAVTLDDMVRAAGAVVRGAPDALVVADLPFLSYATVDEGVHAAGRLLREAGVQAVKLEGGRPVTPVVRRLVELGVPVMGHLGFTPQSTHQIGVRVQAKAADAARELIEDALSLQSAGAFAVVLELVPREVATAVTARLSVPTIGIGAGGGCDGQVQVWHDLLGLAPGPPPRHAKVFADVGAAITAALASYADQVRSGEFPTDAQSSAMPPRALQALLSDPVELSDAQT
jgi:3-methyl-2-oxobutanoate hydroxymethyltransferase